MASGSADTRRARGERIMLDWVRAMLGIASRTKTSNLESFAHWPTQRFERIAQAGRPVTNGGNVAPFGGFLPAFRARPRHLFENRLFHRLVHVRAKRAVSRAL